MPIATTNLVQAVEVWRPDDARQQLAWCAGAYGDWQALVPHRRERTFLRGEGLVGQAWDSGLPVIRPLDSRDSEEGLPADSFTHAVAYPVMKESDCAGVVLLLCNEGEDLKGAFEIWRCSDRGELSLGDSWHAHLERFGRVSQYVNFPRRAGLPGKVWNDRFPRVMGSLGTSSDFVRMAIAKAEGLSMAVGIPMMKSARKLNAVFAILSANRSPIARAMEVWGMDPETQALRIVSADYGPYIDLAPVSRQRTLRPGEGIAGRVYQDAAPWATWDLLGVEFPRGEQFAEYGFRGGVGLPVFVGNELRAVVTLIF